MNALLDCTFHVLIPHPLGPMLHRLPLERSPLLPEQLQQRGLPNALDADDHELETRVGFGVLQDRSQVADDVRGLVGLGGGHGEQGLRQRAAARVQVPQSGERERELEGMCLIGLGTCRVLVWRIATGHGSCQHNV